MDLLAEDVVNRILDTEGGHYTDYPADHGGPTKWGVTIPDLSDHLHKPVTALDIMNLSRADAYKFYMDRYVKGSGYGDLFSGWLLYVVVDGAVNQGMGRMTCWLQDWSGADRDGILGPQTHEAVKKLLDEGQGPQLYRNICAHRIRAYGADIASDRTQAAFARGWMNRIAEFIERTV